MKLAKGIHSSHIFFGMLGKNVKHVRERSSITSAQWRGVGALKENADAADALRGVGGLRSKLMM